MIDLLIAAVVGLGAGSIPFAVLIAKLMGVPDPRSYGSGNPGATNVMRSGNKLAARLVFVCDFLKGTLPVLACDYALLTPGMAAVAGLTAVMGHCWNPWLRLKGGKGVATGYGVLLALDWRILLVALVVWLVFYLALRMVSMPSVVSFIVAMIMAAWLHDYGSYTAAAIAGIAMMITIRHRQNFKDLMEGNERKF